MKDLFNENQQEVEGLTRPVTPLAPQAEAQPTAEPRRRRRTERFAGLIDEADAVPVEEPAQTPPEEKKPEAAAPAKADDRPMPMRPQQPARGVPSPSALS